MKSEKIIELRPYLEPAAATAVDLAAYEARGLRRYRRASICSVVSTAVDCLMSVAIGVCVCVCTWLFFTIR